MEWLNPEANNPEPARRICSESGSSSPDVDRIGFRQNLAERFSRCLSNISRECCLAIIVSLILGTYFKLKKKSIQRMTSNFLELFHS